MPRTIRTTPEIDIIRNLCNRQKDALMCAFLDLFLLALILALGMLILVSIWAVIVILQTVQSQREEKVLRDSFGTEYEAYTRQTWF